MKRFSMILICSVGMLLLGACSSAGNKGNVKENDSIPAEESAVKTEEGKTEEQLGLLQEVRSHKLSKLLDDLDYPMAVSDARVPDGNEIKFITRVLTSEYFDIAYRQEGLQYVDGELSNKDDHYYFNIPLTLTNTSEYGFRFTVHDFKVNGIPTKSTHFTVNLMPDETYAINESLDELAVFHPLPDRLDYDEISFSVTMLTLPLSRITKKYSFVMPADIIPHLTPANVHEFYPDIDTY